jgi:hypothetical protein
VLDVYCLPERDNKFLNFNFSGTHIAIGALIENLNIVSRSRGFRAFFEYFPDDNLPNLVARIRFEPGETASESLAQYVRERHTNRKAYNANPLSCHERQQIIESAQSPGIAVRLIEDPQLKRSIAAACSLMERIALETPFLHRLFFDSLVWSKEEETRRGTGLFIKTLELPPPILALFRIVRFWPVTSLLNHLGFSRAAAMGNAKIYASASALGAVILSDVTPTGFVRAGRVFQRLWLVVTQLGLCLQPVTGITFLFQRLPFGELSVLKRPHAEMVQLAHRQFVQAYQLEANDFIAIHFRIGRGTQATDRSSRRAADVEI